MDICLTVLFILLLFKNYEGLGDVGEAGVAEAKAAKSVRDAWMQLGNTAKAEKILRDDRNNKISPGDIANLYRGNNINGNGASGMPPKHMHKDVGASDYNGALRQISYEMVAIARASQSRIDFLQTNANNPEYTESQRRKWNGQLLDATDKNNKILDHLNDAMNHQHKAWQAREISRGNNNGGDRGHEAMMNTLKTNVMGLQYAYVNEFGKSPAPGRQSKAFSNDANANAAINLITAEATKAVKVAERNTFVARTSPPAIPTTPAWGNFGNGGKGPGGGNAGGSAGSGTGGGSGSGDAVSGTGGSAGSGQGTDNVGRGATTNGVIRRVISRPCLNFKRLNRMANSRRLRENGIIKRSLRRQQDLQKNSSTKFTTRRPHKQSSRIRSPLRRRTRPKINKHKNE